MPNNKKITADKLTAELNQINAFYQSGMRRWQVPLIVSSVVTGGFTLLMQHLVVSRLALDEDHRNNVNNGFLGLLSIVFTIELYFKQTNARHLNRLAVLLTDYDLTDDQLGAVLNLLVAISAHSFHQLELYPNIVKALAVTAKEAEGFYSERAFKVLLTFSNTINNKREVLRALMPDVKIDHQSAMVLQRLQFHFIFTDLVKDKTLINHLASYPSQRQAPVNPRILVLYCGDAATAGVFNHDAIVNGVDKNIPAIARANGFVQAMGYHQHTFHVQDINTAIAPSNDKYDLIILEHPSYFDVVDEARLLASLKQAGSVNGLIIFLNYTGGETAVMRTLLERNRAAFPVVWQGDHVMPVYHADHEVHAYHRVSDPLRQSSRWLRDNVLPASGKGVTVAINVASKHVRGEQRPINPVALLGRLGQLLSNHPKAFFEQQHQAYAKMQSSNFSSAATSVKKQSKK